MEENSHEVSMNFSSAFALFNVKRCIISTFQLSFPKNTYAKKEGSSVSMIGGALKKKKLGKIGPVMEKKVLPVETDPEKLIKYTCGANIYKTGEEIILKPDNEYPEWLWSIRLGPPPTLDELDPTTKQYWRKVRKMGIKRSNQMAKLKKF